MVLHRAHALSLKAGHSWQCQVGTADMLTEDLGVKQAGCLTDLLGNQHLAYHSHLNTSIYCR